ncbi:MAG: hypothetical protein AB8G22_19630 [Saprospiraceae bacterium]
MQILIKNALRFPNRIRDKFCASRLKFRTSFAFQLLLRNILRIPQDFFLKKSSARSRFGYVRSVKISPRLCASAFILLIAQFAFAQSDSLLITKNFKFKDGLYLSAESFQRNEPDLQWQEVRANVFSNPQTFLTQIDNFRLRDTSQYKLLTINEVWGVSLDGIPYLQLANGSTNSELPTFAGLQVRGRLCYFEYEKTEETNVLIQAYNPLNGRPFRSGYVKRTVPVLYQKILNFSTGEIVSFDKANLLDQMEGDSKLYKTVEQLTVNEVDEKLFKCLLIYDDRNPAFIKSKKQAAAAITN